MVGGIIPTVERVTDPSVLGGSERRERMHVGVIHHIWDPERFEAAEERALDSWGRSIIDPGGQPMLRSTCGSEQEKVAYWLEVTLCARRNDKCLAGRRGWPERS